jgi:hypothetical protein
MGLTWPWEWVKDGGLKGAGEFLAGGPWNIGGKIRGWIIDEVNGGPKSHDDSARPPQEHPMKPDEPKKNPVKPKENLDNLFNPELEKYVLIGGAIFFILVLILLIWK